MTDQYGIATTFDYLGKALIAELLASAEVHTFPPNTELVREGQYVKYTPIVLRGLVKVYTHSAEKELLLYYIKPEQSCIMSFSSSINHDKSKVFAITETESTVLLLPSEQIKRWVTQYPAINLLFYQQYDLRYVELVDRIQQMLHHKLDKRFLAYLAAKIQATGQNPVKISHQEIAQDLGTAREVISRLVKKFKAEGIIRQHRDRIELLDPR